MFTSSSPCLCPRCPSLHFASRQIEHCIMSSTATSVSPGLTNTLERSGKVHITSKFSPLSWSKCHIGRQLPRQRARVQTHIGYVCTRLLSKSWFTQWTMKLDHGRWPFFTVRFLKNSIYKVFGLSLGVKWLWRKRNNRESRSECDDRLKYMGSLVKYKVWLFFCLLLSSSSICP